MDALSCLVENPEHRLHLGAATRQQILAKHAGENLQDALLQLYELSMRLPRMSALVNAQDEIYTEEPDVFIQRIFGNDLDLNGVFLQGLRGMPLSRNISATGSGCRRRARSKPKAHMSP